MFDVITKDGILILLYTNIGLSIKLNNETNHDIKGRG